MIPAHRFSLLRCRWGLLHRILHKYHNMKKTLGYIILESVLIIFGVLIGFTLERYRESLADKEQKIQLYKELGNDLENMLKGDIKRLNGRYKSLDKSFKVASK